MACGFESRPAYQQLSLVFWGNMDFQRLTEFVRLTHQYQAVQRAMVVNGGSRSENDLEHAAQLALVAWYINDKDRLGLDPYRLLGLSLAHDLAEVHAGDTYVYGDQAHIASQRDREAEAIKKLAADWADFPSLHQLIAEYEAGQTAEAKFVYSLDKLIPTFNNYLDGGRGWQQKGVRFDQVKAVKTGKADRSLYAVPYFRAMMTELERSPQLFPPTGARPVPPAGADRDRYFLERARRLAATSPEPVGCACLLVQDGRVLAEATNSQRTDHQAVYHAEIKAIMAANQVARSRTLPATTAYCSCEPCAMCLTALATAKVERIAYDKTMADVFPNDPQSKLDARVFVAGLNFVPQLDHLPLR